MRGDKEQPLSQSSKGKEGTWMIFLFFFFFLKKGENRLSQVLQIGNEAHLPPTPHKHLQSTGTHGADLLNRNNNCSPIQFRRDYWFPFRRLAPPPFDSLIGGNRRDPAPRRHSLNCRESPAGEGDRRAITKQSVFCACKQIN